MVSVCGVSIVKTLWFISIRVFLFFSLWYVVYCIKVWFRGLLFIGCFDLFSSSFLSCECHTGLTIHEDL